MFPLDWSAFACVGAIVAVALIMAVVLGRTTGWSRRRVVLVSASTIPLVIIALCFVLIVMAMTSSREQCGIDACGMVAAAAMTFIVVAVISFVLSLIAAAVGHWISRQ
jgi:magnesium-transporting ATPase (P-type)